ncbi:MAG: DUF2188 domain-containing protein [Actinomycetes bacterium]
MPPGKGAQRVYTVEADPKGGWRAKAKGSTRAVAKGDNKAEVVKRTIEVAKKQPKAQVRIKGRNGRIQEEHTYPRSSDPRRTPRTDLREPDQGGRLPAALVNPLEEDGSEAWHIERRLRVCGFSSCRKVLVRGGRRFRSASSSGYLRAAPDERPCARVGGSGRRGKRRSGSGHRSGSFAA